MTTTDASTVRGYVAEHAAGLVDELVDWLRIPSISGNPQHAADVARSAEWLAAALRRTGFPTVEIWPTPGLPAVFAEWPSADADAPTVVVYGHHDVQPIEPVELWHSPPFSPVVSDGRVVGRGAADDKGQVLFHTLGVRAHLAATGRDTPAVHLKVLVEGEEESGSAQFADLLRRYRDRLRCDTVVVSDTGMWSREQPTTVVGMRGLVAGQLDLRGPAGDVHSGSFGGAIRNPATELCRLLARLHDEHGRVTLPGFYDDVVPLSDAERDLFARLPFDETAWLANARSTVPYGESGYTTLERVWARPTAEVNGLWGGHTGPGGKTIVPGEAHAKVSFRLVARQRPAVVQEQFRRWLAANVPDGVQWQLTWESAGVRPCLTPLDAPALQSVRRALAAAYGTEVLVTREGGSGPEADLQEELAAPVVFLGVSLPDDGWHAPNEKVEIGQLLKGAEAAAHLWADLAATLPRG